LCIRLRLEFFKHVLNCVDLHDFGVSLLHQRLYGRGPHALKHGVHALHCGHRFGVNPFNVVVQREQWVAFLRVVERRANHAVHFGLGRRIGGILQARVHDVGGEFFVGFHGNRKVAMTAAGLNVKTHDFVGNKGFLFRLWNDVLVTDAEFIVARGLLVGLNGCALHLDPARRADVLDVEVAQQGRDVGLVYAGAVVAVRIQVQIGALANVPQRFHLVHCGRVFEFQHDELVVLAAVKSVERFSANELAFIRNNGIFVEFSDCLFQFGDESRLGFKPPLFGNLCIKEGLVIANGDATSVALFIDAKHLNRELSFVVGDFFVKSSAAVAAAAATASATATHRRVVHMKIK